MCGIYAGHKSSANSVRSKSRKTITEHTMPSMISNKVSPSGSSLIAQRTGPVTRMDSDGLRGTAPRSSRGGGADPSDWMIPTNSRYRRRPYPPALQPPAGLKPTPSGWLRARGAETPPVSPFTSLPQQQQQQHPLPFSRRRAQTSIVCTYNYGSKSDAAPLSHLVRSSGRINKCVEPVSFLCCRRFRQLYSRSVIL